MKALAIILCNTLNFISKLFGKKGSTIGGYWALKINPNILKQITYPKYVIGVSGSTGKGTTTNLIAGLLKSNNYTIAYNEAGSNALNGIASLILKNVDLKGVFKKDILLMELDEKHSVNILKNFELTHYIVTNITRDQPPRNVHPDYIYNEMNKNVKENVNLIINADDPIAYKLALNHTKSTFYGINKNDYVIKTNLNYLDAAYCPVCGKKLNYEFYHYGHLGKYACPTNDFYRPELNVYADLINVENKKIAINNIELTIKDNYLYTVYAYLATYALGLSIEIPSEAIIKYFNDLLDGYSTPNVYSFENRKWHILVSKNETNLSYKQALDYVVHEPGIKTVVMGFNNCSRRYSQNDISWLWDIDFEELKDDSIEKIVIVGKFKYDILNRLEYGGINNNKCILIDSYEHDLMNTIRNETSGNVYPIVYFDNELVIKDILKKEGVKI